MSTAKILVTPRSVTKNGHPQLERFKERGFEVVFCKPGVQPSEEDLPALLPGCAGYLAGVEKVPARMLEAARGLRVISRNGVGIDNVDLRAAERLGVKVMPAVGGAVDDLLIVLAKKRRGPRRRLKQVAMPRVRAGNSSTRCAHSLA